MNLWLTSGPDKSRLWFKTSVVPQLGVKTTGLGTSAAKPHRRRSHGALGRGGAGRRRTGDGYFDSVVARAKGGGFAEPSCWQRWSVTETSCYSQLEPARMTTNEPFERMRVMGGGPVGGAVHEAAGVFALRHQLSSRAGWIAFLWHVPLHTDSPR